MVKRSDLPLVDPQWHPRHLTGREVLDLAFNRPVPGANLNDPVVHQLRHAALGNLGRLKIQESVQKRYLWLRRDHTDTSWHRSTENVWRWWCVATSQAEVVVYAAADECRVRVDLSTMDAMWHLHALPVLGRMIASCEMGTGFIISEDTVEVDGLDDQAALGLAHDVIELLANRRMTVAR